jgi:hypothetical protein
MAIKEIFIANTLFVLRSLSLLFFCGACLISYGQKEAKIRFVSLKEKTGGFPDAYNKHTFKVNNANLTKKDHFYSFHLHKGIDTISIKNGGYDNKSNHLVFTKFKKKTYNIVPDACSLLQVVPADAKIDSSGGYPMYLGGGGYIRFIIKNRGSDSLFAGGSEFVPNLQEINSRDTTNYFCVFHSGYCPFAITGLVIGRMQGSVSDKSILDDKLFADQNNYCQVRFLFFEEEKYTIIYDQKANSVKILFDGYSDRNKETGVYRQSSCILEKNNGETGK